MLVKARRGSDAAKQGHEYANKLSQLINQFNLKKDTDKNLYNICRRIVEECNINIKDIHSITTKTPLSNISKADFILCVTSLNGIYKEKGISVKKGSESSISLNSQPLTKMLEDVFKIKYPNAYIGLSKWLGLEPYKNMWHKEYGHEDRPQGCYLLEELKVCERQELVNMCTNLDFLKSLLNKIFVCNNELDNEIADILIFPKIVNSMKANDLIICNTEVLVNSLLLEYKNDKNIIQNLNPYAVPKGGIRKNDSIPNTIAFFDSLFTLQRKSSLGKEQTNLLAHINLKKLELKNKQIIKNRNQSIAGQNTHQIQKEFRKKLQEFYPQIKLNEYMIRSSPKSCEIFKENFKSFWLKAKENFNFDNCKEKDVFEGLLYILGVPGYSPIEAFKRNKVEKINKNELILLKSLPYYYLKGSIKQEIKTFFDDNLRTFLTESIFNNRGKKIKGIIYNNSVYKNTHIVEPLIIDQNKFLDDAVNIYSEQDFNSKNRSLNLGILYFKRYGGGGAYSTEERRSELSLTLSNAGLNRL